MGERAREEHAITNRKRALPVSYATRAHVGGRFTDRDSLVKLSSPMTGTCDTYFSSHAASLGASFRRTATKRGRAHKYTNASEGQAGAGRGQRDEAENYERMEPCFVESSV